MRRPLKIVAWSAGGAVVLFMALLLPKLYPGFFLKTWLTTITVDGKESGGSSLYLNRWGLLIRRNSSGTELYLFAGDDERGWVWRCEASTFSVLPGFALTSNERFNRGCLFPTRGELDMNGKVIRKPRSMRVQLISGHSAEFIAEDGKRVKAEW